MGTSEKYPLIEQENDVLVAGVIYLLMNKTYHISRNVRVHWFLQHLNTTISPSCRTDVTDVDDTELTVLSVIPQEPPPEWRPECGHLYRYLITTSSNVVFLSEIYRTVYCLDMSPSISAMDIQHGQIMIDEMVETLNRSLRGVVKPFFVPGSCIKFEPQIFVTVIVHTPFFTTPAQQVLVQGWQVTGDNLDEFLSAIQKQLQLLEDTIAEVSALAYDQLEAVRMRQLESEKLVGALFEENSEKQIPTEITMVSPDSGFINLLRYGMLALRLLPPSSSSNLIVVTDGIIALPDIHVLDSVLTQLHTNAVAVSFLHVGSQFHPHCSQGQVPYSELMQFIACATLGAYIPSASIVTTDDELNFYHEAFLTWSFKKENSVQELVTPMPHIGEWNVSNQSFYGNREPQLLNKKQVEDILNTSVTSILCCRLREGFMIKSIYLKDSQLELNLVLPWANHIYIEYLVASQWPNSSASGVRYAISIRAPYEFLHDITCLLKKQFQSPYRQAVVSRFWSTLKTLTQSDLLLAHLDSFSSYPNSYLVPESIRSGMPLFYLPSNNAPPVLCSSDPSCPHFAQFWRPVCLIDPSVWHKWLHTYRLCLILQHDLPLPRYLHTASPNGRYQSVQSRHASATLYNFLKDWTSFVLIENHSYLKLISSGESDKTPTWFYIIRVISKPTLAVLHIAFLGGTPGKLRHQIAEKLKERISALKIPQRLATKEALVRNLLEGVPKEKKTRSEVPCCILLQKPLEKILIRYERMPSEFGTVVFPDGTQPHTAAKPLRPTSSLVTTLSRYLHHRRWVWTASAHNYSLGHSAVARILATLTNMRLQEGFKFAHSSAGIVNMVLEVQMKCCDEDMDHTCKNCRPSVIQYVLFPLRVTTPAGKSSSSDEEGTDDAEGDTNDETTLELIAECWIEPQHGVVAKGPASRAYMENLPYHQLADVMWRMDAECISALLTFEHLCLMCQNPQVLPPVTVNLLDAQPQNPLENWPDAVALSDKRIHCIPFAYDLMIILPKCQQVELQFSMFIQEIIEQWDMKSPGDAPNFLLMETLFNQLRESHDKELFLNAQESKQFVDLIVTRERDEEKHPIPFPRRYSQDYEAKSKSSKTSEPEIQISTEKINSLNDLSKKRLSLEDEDVFISFQTPSTNTNLPSPNATKGRETPDKGLRKSCGPLYRMYPKAPPKMHKRRDSDAEPGTPRWRCFLKGMTPTHCILTFVPASFRDLKALMLGAETKTFKLISQSDFQCDDIKFKENLMKEQKEIDKRLALESTLNPEAKPFLPSRNVMENPSEIIQREASGYGTSAPSKGWILEDVNSTSSIFDPDFKDSELWDMSDQKLEAGHPFRVRASSWEPFKTETICPPDNDLLNRLRARSMGSRGKDWTENKFKKKHSSEKSSMHFVHDAQTTKGVLGSLTIPIYVYDCPLSNLDEALVLKHQYVKQYKDQYYQRTFQDEVQSGFAPLDNDFMNQFDWPETKSDDSDSTSEDQDIRQHCRLICEAFNKSFVVSLFKSLHLGQNINALNVQTAVDECEKTMVEINITKYLQTVCSHLKDVNNQCLDLSSRDKLFTSENESKIPLSLIRTPGPCQEYRHLHNLIKNKFLRILTVCFKAVPSNPDFYFCSPNWERERLEVSNEVIDDGPRTIEHCPDFDSMTFQPDEFRSDHGSVLGANPWEALGSATTPDDARTSLLSNMDSDSVSDFPEDEVSEDISPLFLHLICTVQSMGNIGKCSVRMLPTCFSDVLEGIDFPDDHIDLQDLGISLDIICLTLPPQGDKFTLPMHQPQIDVIGAGGLSVIPHSSVTVSVSPNVIVGNKHEAQQTFAATEEHFPQGIGFTPMDKLLHLPDYQHKAISTCVEEIKWLMDDEIAAFLLDLSPVTEATLQLVANHVTTSTGRSSCIMEVVPLQFVYSPEQSLAKFVQEFSIMQLPGYSLKKENEFYYVTKEVSTSSARQDTCGNDPATSISELTDTWLTSNQSNETTIPDFCSTITGLTPSDSARVFTIDLKQFGSGWSSVSAWHKEVASMMLSGHISEGFSDLKNRVYNSEETSTWLKELEFKRPLLPNFWLIMKVNQDAVTTYFHCRFLELETNAVKMYSLVQRNAVLNIKFVCKTVNQTMLLNNLHDTRMCNQLLEPEGSDDDIWKTNQSIKSAEEGESEHNGSSLEGDHKFVPGCFSCKVVWETHFVLHPRLKTGPGKQGLSRGIQALRTVLNRFSVNNRKNMFVYQDHSGNVFYLRLHENMRLHSKLQDMDDNSPSSVSRSSSINSLNNANIRKSEDQLLFALKEVRPRVKSFGELAEGLSSIRQEEFLTLKVHGISEAGPEVKNELVQVLQNRLDDAVLEVVSVMLARNPMCKLSPDDVHFIQRPHHPPESVIQFTVQPHALCHLQALSYYLRQNLLQFLYTPKYTDARPQYHFQDYSQPEDSGKHIPEKNLFLYNQSPASGNKGIACIAVALVDHDSSLIQQFDQPRSKVTAYKDNPISVSQFHDLTTTTVYERNPANFNSGPDALIEFRIWKQGRVNIEALSIKLKAAIRHSLWDLLLELNLLSAPLSESYPLNLDIDDYDENLCQGPLHGIYQNVMDSWMQFGSSIGVPAVRTNVVTLAQRHSVMVTLKEVHALASLNDTKGFVYYQATTGKKQYLPFDWNMKLPSYTKCMIIARNVGQWKACLSDEPSLHSEKVDPKAQKVLQKFPPLLESSFGETVSFAPRQRFLIALLSNEKIVIHTYNWAKDLMESLTKQMGSLGMWLSSRSNLLTGIISQKLGVFHNQPSVRKTMSQITDVETLVTFPGASRPVRTGSPTVMQVLEVLRDTKSVPAKTSISTDHVVIYVQQLLDTRNHYKHDHQKKLYTMWQTRGATPNIPQAEDILELFIQHSRFIHYCLTPLLFLPRWRILSSATRDHLLKACKKELQAPVMDFHKHMGNPEEKWHHTLCIDFINEYKQYLQTLGFIPIQTGLTTPRKGGAAVARAFCRRGKNRCYLQKSLLGGILLFELFICEPFFHAKLHAIECFRLEGKSSSALISQFTLSFLDECDKIKVLMHLHSFTYDYHLRCLHGFIAGKQPLLKSGYHITSFLDDFLKYYSKAPNYARNLVHSGFLNVPKVTTPSNQLFTYLLSHENIYDMEVVHMIPVHVNVIERTSPEDTECVLVKLSSTPHVTYKDLHDVKQTDDFDITLIVAQEDIPDQTTLSLRYFVVLTSRRESYPKLDVEKKLGKFRTVPIPNPSGLMYPVSRPVYPPLTVAESLEGVKGDFNESSENRGIIISTIEVRPESINYLGYYSSHEQVMQQLILEYAQTAHAQIEAIIKQGSLHCRTHHLWNKLQSVTTVGQQMTYMEFSELYNLAEVQMVTDADPRLTPMLYQSISWYQSLIKLLIQKYGDHHRLFVSPDANTQHLLILHPKFLEGFVMLTVDTQTGKGEMIIVSRKPLDSQTEVSKKDLHSLVEDTVNTCCFHLWVGLL